MPHTHDDLDNMPEGAEARRLAIDHLRAAVQLLDAADEGRAALAALEALSFLGQAEAEW